MCAQEGFVNFLVETEGVLESLLPGMIVLPAEEESRGQRLYC